jgi:hypothetical protein
MEYTKDVSEKEYLLYLHLKLYEFRKYCEETHLIEEYFFEEYDDFGVPPSYVHRKIDDHKKAIFLLANSLVSAIKIETERDKYK